MQKKTHRKRNYTGWMIPILLLVQGVGGMESSHGSLNKSAKIPVLIKKTNLRLGLSGNDERIKKRRKTLCHYCTHIF